MKLINTKTFELEEFLGSKVPSYAILSHTWGSEEVSIQEWEAWLKTGDESVASKAGFLKIIKTCRIAADSGIGYAWVDTNCIDKSSSAELTEAINSMLAFYRDAVVCYAHLSDYESDCLPDDPEQVAEALSHCRWFSRGWTLQELLAPENLILFSSCWTPLGSKKSLLGPLSLVTKIDSWYLEDFHTNGRYCSIARKMSWASRRQTTRPEDLSYCLIGLFDISMPLLYGEGDKAFRRAAGGNHESLDRSHYICMGVAPMAGFRDGLGYVSRAIPSCFPQQRQSGRRLGPSLRSGGENLLHDQLRSVAQRPSPEHLRRAVRLRRPLLSAGRRR